MIEDKQIIIDGVDVSGCKHYKNRTCIADYCLTDMPFGEAKCEKNPNCYYKQLQREKQDSQEARDTAIKEFNRAEKLKTLLERKEQERERLKQTLIEIKEVVEICSVVDSSELLLKRMKHILREISEVLNKT